MMDRQDIQKLLGGYATGTLTPEEQQVLFEAALTDQELFDALAREQSLRDLLRDPAARAHLLAATDEKPLPWYRRYWRPAAMVGAAVACLLMAGIYLKRPRPQPAAAPLLVAEMKAPEVAAPPATVQPSAPQMERTPKSKPAPAPGNHPLRDSAIAVKKEPVEPPPPPEPAASPVAPPAARKELAKDSANQIQVTASESVVQAQPLAPRAAAPAPQALGSIGGVQQAQQGLQSSFRQTSSQAIPLQNAQDLFYASPALDVTTGAEQQYLAPQQKQQQSDKKERTQQTTGALKTFAGLAGARAPHLGVVWTILRQRDGGDFVQVDADQLRAGDAIKLRLLPNDAGFLSVWDGSTAVMQATGVERLVPKETPVIRADQAGQKILTVQLTRTAQQPGLVRKATEQQSATDSAEHAHYVLNVNESQVAPVSVVIPLTFK